ncbi:sugar ABC transporter permease [Paenibacillus pectinilyticus]|uniref:Sugar ABC transporter permease n=1 Tax=Paenibacillus pectinilyticus TaxID=512399 RepID=A0A1C1A3Z3_9BACL|nr:carbohydrate ABC transporter permease [Paenibacillus pectinilyticus]OCT15273.1 sugar ABC transporter permease [Paenibacillus pectinilyticus]
MKKPLWLQALDYLILIIAAIVILLPILLLLIAALKTPREFSVTSPFMLPADWFNMANFVSVIKKAHLGLAFINILFIMIVTILGNVLIGTMAAYAIGRFQFRLRKWIMALYTFAFIVPGITTQVATFTIIKNLGLFNTHFAMILLNLGSDVVQIYIYLQFIRSIPRELDESAYLDGASLFRIYRTIIFPLLRPATATVIILKAIGIYNDIFTPYLYMPSSKLVVISTTLTKYTDAYGSQWNMISAASLLIIIPTVVMFIVLQKYIFDGIVNGAVKS